MGHPIVAAFVAAAALGAAGSVFAQTSDTASDAPVSTASAVSSHPTTDEQIKQYLASSPAARPTVDSLYDDGPMGVTGRSTDEPRKIHGEVGVSVGTGGYRSGYVVTEIPVGERGTLGLAYSQTDFGKTGGYVYGAPGYGYGYGYPVDVGVRESLSASYRTNGIGQPSLTSSCAPGFWDGDRYVEPAWVGAMRGPGERCRPGQVR